MDAIKFIKESKRMCKSFSDNCACAECPANTGLQLCKISRSYECSAEEKLSIVEEWAKEHPAKTRQSVLLEQYPNAKRDFSDILCICPAEIFGDTVCQEERASCSNCRHKFWMQEVE